MFYYAKDGAKFASKVKAIEYGRKTSQQILYYYHDDVYKNVAWKVEPTESLEQLYRAQAERLRAKYDYLILCYSGGYDSTNILETFYFNNIKLDKIVIVGAFGQDSRSGVDENHNGELYSNAFPYVEHLGLQSITEVHDYTKSFNDLKNFSVHKYGTEWVDETGGWFSPHNWFWRDLESHVVPSSVNGRVGIIFGRDKPSLDSNRFCFRDNPVNSYGNVFGVDGVDRVNFYWDPEFTPILVKQLHVLKRAQQRFKFEFDADIGSQRSGSISNNDIIYDLKRPLAFKSPKSKTSVISLRDQYMLGKKDSDIFKFFTDGIKSIDRRIGLDNLRAIPTRYYEV